MLQADRSSHHRVAPTKRCKNLVSGKTSAGEASTRTGQVKLPWSRLMTGTISDYTEDLQLSLTLRRCLTA